MNSSMSVISFSYPEISLSAMSSSPKSKNCDNVVVDETSPQHGVDLSRLLQIERQKSANLQLEVAELRQKAADITQVRDG